MDRSQAPPVFWQRELFAEEPREPVPDRLLVDVSRVRVERVRDFGEAWLALVLWQKLGLDSLLRDSLPAGQEEIVSVHGDCPDFRGARDVTVGGRRFAAKMGLSPACDARRGQVHVFGPTSVGETRLVGRKMDQSPACP